MPFGDLVFRHWVLPTVELEITPIRNFKGITDSLRGVILQCLFHFVNTFKVEVVVITEPLLVIKGFLRLDTEEDIVHPMIGFA